MAKEPEAVDVLKEQMMLHRDELQQAFEKLQELIKKDYPDIKFLKWLAKEIVKCRDIVIDCAAKLAPYQTPKLESTEIKQKVEHKYVIFAPNKNKDTKEWIHDIEIDRRMMQIDREKKILAQDAEIIEDN